MVMLVNLSQQDSLWNDELATFITGFHTNLVSLTDASYKSQGLSAVDFNKFFTLDSHSRTRGHS